MSHQPDVTVYGEITDVWGENLQEYSVETDHPDFPLIEASISFRKGDRKIRVKNGQKARVTMMWWKPPGGRKAKWVVRSWEILTDGEPDSSHVFAPGAEEEVPKGPASFLDDVPDPAKIRKKSRVPENETRATGSFPITPPLRKEAPKYPASYLDDAWLPEEDGAPFEPEVDAGRGVDLPEKVEASDFLEGIRALQAKEEPERPVPLVPEHVGLKGNPVPDLDPGKTRRKYWWQRGKK